MRSWVNVRSGSELVTTSNLKPTHKCTWYRNWSGASHPNLHSTVDNYLSPEPQPKSINHSRKTSHHTICSKSNPAKRSVHNMYTMVPTVQYIMMTVGPSRWGLRFRVFAAKNLWTHKINVICITFRGKLVIIKIINFGNYPLLSPFFDGQTLFQHIPLWYRLYNTIKTIMIPKNF